MKGHYKNSAISSAIQRMKINGARWLPTVGQQRCRSIAHLIAISLVCFVFVTYLGGNPPARPYEDNNNAITQETLPMQQSEEKPPETKEPKTILFWTPYYDRKDFTIGLGKDPFVKAGCKVTNCIATADRALVNQSDAILFHALQFHKNDVPAHRLPHQRYIFFLYETIPNSTLPCIGKCLPESEYSPNFFNWTMTHRRDSDVYVAEPYGAIAPKYWVLPAQMPDELPVGVHPADPAKLLSRSHYPQLANRTKMVAWFNSHCPTHSQREDYVNELSKHVQVDVYGKCGTMQCLPRNDPRCEVLLDQYKFYFAAENSLCPDYVSEKFYRALLNNLVPIVYGGADYTQYAPPHSYINAADFAHAKDLADYLHLLAKNPSLYLRYFEWKSLYKVIRSPMKGWCDLCAKLNREDNGGPRKSYEDVGSWWVRQWPCYPGSSFLKDHM